MRTFDCTLEQLAHPNKQTVTDKLKMIQALVVDLDECVGSGEYVTQDDLNTMRCIDGHITAIEREITAKERLNDFF